MGQRSTTRLAINALAAMLLTTGCYSKPSIVKTKGSPVSQRLATQLANPKVSGSVPVSEVQYLARFKTADEAAAHKLQLEQLKSPLTQVKTIDSEGRILAVTVAAGAVNDVTIADNAAVSLDTGVQLIRPNGRDGRDDQVASGPNASEPEVDVATDYLTARRVVGVEDLLARFPTADGRNQKVAVFDSGIEFGLEGVSDNSGAEPKLLGFYDLTNFGQVTARALTDTTVQSSYDVDGNQIAFAPGFAAPQSILATGVLSERLLAQSNLAGTGVDLNGDGVDNTEYAFLVGIARDGYQAVWLDINKNGLIDASESEELADYNTSYRHIILRPATSPAGASPLAVTINSPTSLQFHSLASGHGTSCATIIAGDGYANGRLKGMAPKAKLVAYTLDRSGQDVYTMTQFLSMFLHAKAQGVDAISISWGFATADLESARFVSSFLDEEIASQGIVIGIANGNNGPGVGSAADIDYMPHNGFAVGAAVTEVQARNVYGWLGQVGDHVVYYSSIGPSRGGRPVPDVVSPLMTMVRGERGTGAARFYPFGGTSSATPALIGAITALSSAIKQLDNSVIDVQVLKLAVQATARPLTGHSALAQGAGMINVNAAYDEYFRLMAEKRAAVQDTTRRTAFAYDLRAATPLQDQVGLGEGVHLKGFNPAARVNIKLTPASLALVDSQTFVEPVRLVHSESFFEVPELITLQAVGGTTSGFNLRFDETLKSRPGVYTDVVEVKRLRDNLTLLRIPVVVEIPAISDSLGQIKTFAGIGTGTLTPFAVWRQPFVLDADQAGSVLLDGVVLNNAGTQNGRLLIAVQDVFGHQVHSEQITIDQGVTSLRWATPALAPGFYELLIAPNFRSPGAVLNNLEVTAALHLPTVKVIAAQRQGDVLRVAVQSLVDLSVAKAELNIVGHEQSVNLVLDRTAARPGYYGQVEIAAGAAGNMKLQALLVQEAFDRLTAGFANVSLAVNDVATSDTLYRGWNDLQLETGTFSDLGLRRDVVAGQALDLIAYPNIFRADVATAEHLQIDLRALWASPAKFATTGSAVALGRGNITTLTLNAPALVAPLPAGLPLVGDLNLFDAAGRPLAERLPVRLAP